MRAAIAGATIANEVRVIAAWLAGKKNVQLVQVSDLMVDTMRGKDVTSEGKADGKPKPKSHSSAKPRSKASDDDRIAAENYYRLWARSLQAKLDDAQRIEKPNRVIDRDRNRKRNRPTPGRS